MLILSQALEEGDLIRDQILTMTGLSIDLVLLECYCDAQNALEALNNNTPPQTTTPNRNEFALIKQFVDDKKVKNLVWVKGAEQMAESHSCSSVCYDHLSDKDIVMYDIDTL